MTADDVSFKRLYFASSIICQRQRHRRLAMRWMLSGIPMALLYAWMVLAFGRSVFTSVVLGAIIFCGLRVSAHRGAMGVWEEINRG